MKKNIFKILLWAFGIYFSIAFWCAIIVFVALLLAKPLIFAVETALGILAVSFISFVVAGILTYFFAR